jgi:hypothetical protein
MSGRFIKSGVLYFTGASVCQTVLSGSLNSLRFMLTGAELCVELAPRNNHRRWSGST